MPRTPNTKIQFFNVPWDSGYRNIRYFSSASQRDSWFAERSHITYPDYSSAVSNAQPVKDGIPYTVRNNWDTMHNYNYCRYKNEGYDGSDWQYAFITGWAYASEHSATFSFTRDAYVNNIGRMTFAKSFIERETTSTVNDLPEPIGVNRHVNRNFGNFFRGGLSFYYGIVYQGDINNPDSTQTWTGKSEIDGIDYGGMSIMLMTSYEGMIGKIVGAANAGKLSNVINTFVIPRAYISEFPNYETRVLQFNVDDYTYTRGTSYTPKNKKAQRFPFCYLVYGDYFGNVKMARWEDLNDTSVHFRYYGSATPTGYITLDIIGAKSQLTGIQTISHSVTTNLGYSLSGYQTWLALNQNNMQATNRQTYINNVAAQASAGLSIDLLQKQTSNSELRGAIGGLTNFANSAINGDLHGGINAGISAIQDYIFTESSVGNQQSYIEQSFRNQRDVNLANTQLSLNVAKTDAKELPNNGGVPSGGIAGLMSQNKLGFYAISVEPCKSEYEAIDRYFERFGYCVNRLGSPSFEFIRNHYFIKTNGMIVRGACPQQDRDVLMRIFDRGVTFWDKDDFSYTF